jgi:homoserine dehydrogenase
MRQPDRDPGIRRAPTRGIVREDKLDIAAQGHTASGAGRRSTHARRLFLLGSGVVGSAFVDHHRRHGAALRLPPIAGIANSRGFAMVSGEPVEALHRLNRLPGGLDAGFDAVALRAGDVVVDATASVALAGQHAGWLGNGVDVVTANKMGAGGSLSSAHALARACESTGAVYGDSATVGAGLPLLASLRRLVRGGDEILRIEGVLSGSLAWLFARFDGETPFSELVSLAQAAGLTEPDPRVDLSGEDVARKLLILARAAGMPLERDALVVEGLVPAPGTRVRADAQAGHPHLGADLDADLAARRAAAAANDEQLCYVGSVDAGGGRVGLRRLPRGHALRDGCGTDNRVAIFSSRYRDRPLVIQGAGAGPLITAAALLDDLLAVLERRDPAYSPSRKERSLADA